MSAARRFLLIGRFGDAVIAVADGEADAPAAGRALARIVGTTREFDGIWAVRDLVIIVYADAGVVRVSALSADGPIGTGTTADGEAVAELFAGVLVRLRAASAVRSPSA